MGLEYDDNSEDNLLAFSLVIPTTLVRVLPLKKSVNGFIDINVNLPVLFPLSSPIRLEVLEGLTNDITTMEVIRTVRGNALSNEISALTPNYLIKTRSFSNFIALRIVPQLAISGTLDIVVKL